MNFRPSPSPRFRSAALTLVELLVVLSIVAVLSTVALRSVVGVFEEKNYDANISQLGEIEKAVLGDSSMSGFLGDIGRLPVSVGDADPTNLKQLSELWDQGALLDYTIASPTGDTEVKLGTGWRGPYLNLGINRSTLTDGFANRFLLWQADGTDADDGDPIAIVQSLGADGLAGGTSFNEDLAVVFQADAGAVPALADAVTDRWRTDVTVNVIRDGGPILSNDSTNLVVRAYGADGSGGLHTVAQEKFTLTADVPSQTFTLTNLPYGYQVLRAYQESTDPITKDTAIITDPPPILPATSPHERKSPAAPVVIDRFTGTITLTLY